MKIKILLFIIYLLFFGQAGIGQKLTFALLADLHVNPNSENDSALHQIVDELNKAVFDFVVVCGDITNTGSDAELEAVFNSLSRLNKPYYVIPGNHETNWSGSAGLQFNYLFGNDRFLFRKNGFLVVGTNTGPFMRMGDGLVKKEDVLWLSRELEKANGNMEPLIVFSHYPLAEGLSNWGSVTGILKKNNCILSFCGHGHRISLLNFDGITGIMGRLCFCISKRSWQSYGSGFNKVELSDT
jgi:3',5'-cyclic AMP phosphodiesterase CpdA